MPDMQGIKEKISQPIGPLPAYAWVIVIVGGYFGYRFLSGRSGGSSGSATVVGGTALPATDSSAATDLTGIQQQINQLVDRVNQLPPLQALPPNLPSPFGGSGGTTSLPTPLGIIQYADNTARPSISASISGATPAFNAPTTPQEVYNDIASNASTSGLAQLQKQVATGLSISNEPIDSKTLAIGGNPATAADIQVQTKVAAVAESVKAATINNPAATTAQKTAATTVAAQAQQAKAVATQTAIPTKTKKAM
jgi:hypothetical protein